VFLGLWPGWNARAAERVLLSEFMAANTRTIATAPNLFDDWIELRNLEPNAVDLAGWSLTDNVKTPRLWTFPSVTLPAGGHLLVWASGREARQPGRPLHANFKLGSSGEYLALIRPDGSIATAFSPRYPPQSPDVSYGFMPGSTQAVYFLSPTPGRPNESTTNLPGPLIATVTNSPPLPATNGPVTVTVGVVPFQNPVTNVTLWWRIMFHRETNVVMSRADDGRWTATIPAETARAGEILRWRVTATDAAGRQSRLPLAGNPAVASRYFGIVLAPRTVESALPVFDLFLAPQQMGRAESERGAYGCFVYNGEFYDQVLVKVRGNTTAGFPKKSHRLEFPHDHPLRHPGPGGRVRHTSLMAEYGDPTYLRQHLSFWMQEQTGSSAPFHYPVRVQLNGEFWQLAMHSEVLGEELLARHGLNPEGALYKAVGLLTPDHASTGGFEKKTRRHEDDTDYQALAHSLQDSRSVAARRTALFERWNIPAVINYMAAARLTQEDDDIWANLSLYHDNDGTGEWRPIPFDMNVSWGFSFAHGGIRATTDNVRSHPFFGAAGVGANQGHNRLFDAVVRVPETRAMLLRRMRTILDEWWQAPDTPVLQRRIEQHIAVLTNQFWPEAVLDRQKWGEGWNSPRKAAGETSLSAGVRDLMNQFIEPRRKHFYITHSATNFTRPVGVSERHNAGVPSAQDEHVMLGLGPFDPSPTAPIQAYLTLTNAHDVAVDISRWRLDGAVQFTFASGTVLPPASLLYVAAERNAFRRRVEGPRSSQGLFVVGNFRGAITTNTGVILKDAHGRIATPAPK
jgi:hypothetical protein